MSLKRKNQCGKEEEEEAVAGKREKLDACLLEASEGHAVEGGNVGPSRSHDSSDQRGEGEEVGSSEPHGGSGRHPHNKGFFSPYICIHTGNFVYIYSTQILQ